MTPRRRWLLILTLTPLTLLLVGLGVLAYLLYRVQEWTGEIPAVVTSVSPDDQGMFVTLVGPAPPDRMSGNLPTSAMAPLLSGAAEGDRLVCVVRQTFQANSDLATGPDHEVLSCRVHR